MKIKTVLLILLVLVLLASAVALYQHKQNQEHSLYFHENHSNILLYIKV